MAAAGRDSFQKRSRKFRRLAEGQRLHRIEKRRPFEFDTYSLGKILVITAYSEQKRILEEKLSAIPHAELPPSSGPSEQLTILEATKPKLSSALSCAWKTRASSRRMKDWQ